MNAIDKNGMTPLMYASEGEQHMYPETYFTMYVSEDRYRKVKELLIANGATV